MYQRSRELGQAAKRWMEADPGHKIGMMTLTMRHDRVQVDADGQVLNPDQLLANLWDALSGAWRHMTQSKTWRPFRAHAGHQLRATEITYGDAGWHVHLHVVVFLTLEPPQAAVDAVMDQWITSLRNFGYDALADVQDWRIFVDKDGSAVKAAAYAAKGDFATAAIHQAAADAKTAAISTKIGVEATRSDLKRAKRGSRTPWQILAALLSDHKMTGAISYYDDGPTGLGDHRNRDQRLWDEYEVASKGRRAQVWSRGARAFFGLDEHLDDATIAAEETGTVDDTLMLIPASEWAKARLIPELAPRLLLAAESGPDREHGLWAASALLRSNAIEHEVGGALQELRRRRNQTRDVGG